MTMEIIERNENVCDSCGQVTEGELYFVRGIREDKRVCEDCLSDFNYDDYEEEHTEWSVIEVQGTGGRYITDKRDIRHRHDVYICDCCGDAYEEDDCRFDDYGNIICENCYDYYDYTTCYECGRLISGDDIRWHNDNCYCSECVPEEYMGLIEEYDHTRYGLTFYKCDDEPETNEFFGVELEVDHGEERGYCSEEIDRVTPMEMYFKKDSSLNEGFEIVSSPATLKYHLEQANWDEIQRVARDRNFRSHDTDTCGLHVHVSRDAFGQTEIEQDLHIAILMMLEKKFADKFHTFARRYSPQWAKDNLIDINENDNYQSIKKKADAFKRDRYYAINVSNSETVEFRCFRGTLRNETLIATLQFVATMTRYCQQITVAEVESVEWEDIFYNTEYPELREYMVSRGLL